LSGGLNIYDLDYRLGVNESPDMKNLNWNDGVLSSRDGQVWVSSTALGVGYACAPELFWGKMFFHVGAKLYYMDPDAATPTMTELYTGVSEIRGTFFRYGDYLMYKTRGAYIQIRYISASDTFGAIDVVPYVPIIQINTDPTSHSGDEYQSENRLSAKKTVWYNASEATYTKSAAGDGSTKAFSIGYTSATRLGRVKYVMLGTTTASTAAYTVDLSTGTVTFSTAPTAGTAISIIYTLSTAAYYLPVQNIDSVDSVTVNGTVKTAGTDYTVDLTTGCVLFSDAAAPLVTDPATNNAVVITYSKANTAAYDSVMNCRYAAVYGGNTDMCVVLGGCPAQPNAYFWSGNTSLAMDPGYFPFINYNFAGDSDEAITGFGKQQGLLVVFKEHSVGKATYSLTTVNDLARITMDYVNINSRVGCDLPWTIQLIENNLVFCNTSQGVHIVLNSSAAQENNIVGISRKVNGGENNKTGLLDVVRKADSDTVCSYDNDRKYVVVVSGVAYEWDYILSTYSSPTWFYHDNIAAKAFCQDLTRVWHMDIQGRVTLFSRVYADYGAAIEKIYQFPTQHFGTYDRLKNILAVEFATRSDVDTTLRITWMCDYMDCEELVPIVSQTWVLSPRNLAHRCLAVRRYANVAKRKPGFKHVRHFAMRITNAAAGEDLSIISAQIFYNFQGRDR
jgi:hypothetical protein